MEPIFIQVKSSFRPHVFIFFPFPAWLFQPSFQQSFHPSSRHGAWLSPPLACFDCAMSCAFCSSALASISSFALPGPGGGCPQKAADHRGKSMGSSNVAFHPICVTESAPNIYRQDCLVPQNHMSGCTKVGNMYYLYLFTVYVGDHDHMG